MGGSDDDRVVIETNGTLRVEGPELQRRLRLAAGRWRWIDASPDLALLTRRTRGEVEKRWLMAGEIITRTTVMEVVSMLAQFGWSGELGVHGAGSSRYINIGDGILRAARSDASNERLGELLVTMDLLSTQQLEQCVSAGDKERRLGELALERGFVTSEQLFTALRSQMRLIFQNALLEDTGHYALVQAPDDDEAFAPAFVEHIPLQELLMDSVRRIDEMAVFRQRIPNGDVCPVLSERGYRVTVRASLRPVLALADGEHTVLDIAQALHKDEYETTKMVCQLLQVGAVEIKTQRTLNAQQALRMVTRFNHILRRIFEAAHRHGKRQDLYRTLTSWVDDTPLSAFFSETLSIEGELGPDRVVARLHDKNEDPPLEALHQSLQELAAFAMLSVGSMLPREAERHLSQLVRHKLGRLRYTND